MKLYALVILTLIALSVSLESASAERPDSERPNVVVIFIDDMGFADPSCFGNPLIKTPHIDRLAAEGIKLTNFYVNSPICSASRVALTTGQYQARWKIHSYLNTRAGNANRGMANYLDPSAPTTAKKLKAAGYATAHFGKWHMGGGRDVDDAPLPQAYGFDESLVSFEGLGDRIIENNPNAIARARALGHGKIIPCERWERMQIQTDRTIDFIRRHRDSPFYVRLFPNDVHDAHVPLPGSADKFKSVSDDPYVRDFFAVLEEMDKQIGRVIATIDELNLGKKTLVIFTSDNGAGWRSIPTRRLISDLFLNLESYRAASIHATPLASVDYCLVRRHGDGRLPAKASTLQQGRDDQRLLAASAGDAAEDAGPVCF